MNSIRSRFHAGSKRGNEAISAAPKAFFGTKHKFNFFAEEQSKTEHKEVHI
jgi:hypothetical protein